MFAKGKVKRDMFFQWKKYKKIFKKSKFFATIDLDWEENIFFSYLSKTFFYILRMKELPNDNK